MFKITFATCTFNFNHDESIFSLDSQIHRYIAEFVELTKCFDCITVVSNSTASDNIQVQSFTSTFHNCVYFEWASGTHDFLYHDNFSYKKHRITYLVIMSPNMGVLTVTIYRDIQRTCSLQHSPSISLYFKVNTRIKAHNINNQLTHPVIKSNVFLI